MRRLARLFRHLVGSIILLLLLVLAALLFLVNTQPGLQLAGRLLDEQLGDMLQLGTLQGSLSSVVVARDVDIAVAGGHYRIGQLEIDWSPLALARGELRVHRLLAADLDITPAASDDAEKEPFQLDLELPVRIALGSAQVTKIAIHSPDGEAFEVNSATLSATAAGDRIQIETLTLAMPGLTAGLDGTLGLRPSRPSDLQLEWVLQGAALDTAGQARLRGQLDDYTLEARAALSGEQIPEGVWQLAGDGNLEGIALGRLEGEVLGGRVNGTGRLGWQDGLDWQADVAVTGIDPGRFQADWPGSLAARLVNTGGVHDGQWQTRLQLDGLEGELRGYPVRGEIDAALAADRVTLDSLTLVSGSNRINASGRIDSRWDLSFEAALADLAVLVPDWTGQLAARGSVSGERAHPVITASADGSQLAGPGVSLDTLAAEAAIAWRETADQSVKVTVTGLGLAGEDVETASLDLDGTLHAHRLDVLATGPESSVALALEGDWQGDRWAGRLARADWAYPAAGAWTLQRPVSLQLGQRAIAVPETCWVQGDARLCIDAAGDPAARLATGARLQAFPLLALQALADSPVQVDSRIDAELQATLQAGALQGGKLQASLSPGVVDYRDADLPTDTRIGGGTLAATLDATGLDAQAALELTGSDFLQASLGLPGYQAGITPWEQQPMDLQIRGELREMLILRYLLEEVGRYEGTLALDLKGGGTLARPRLSGGARVEDARFEVDALGIEISALDVRVSSRDDGLTVKGEGTSGKGRLQLEGDIIVTDIATWEADLRLHGKDFEVMHLPEGIIEISPDIRARLSPPALQLSGEVHVPYARLRPRDISSRSGVSRDVVIITEDTPEVPPERWRVSSDIRLSLGDDVSIDGFGLSGYLTGSVNLTDVPGQVTTARGQLAIERGSYEAYSRELSISRGQLLFSGGPVDNPGLDFEASRQIGVITAGIRARGTLRNPELELFSNPTMSDADIISYIAFGKPQSEIGQGEGSMTDAGLLAGGNMLAGMLGSRLGLEELGVEGGETLDEAAMVLGTYLSPQIYVRYRTGLYDAINEFEVRFELSRRWSVRTITSAEASAAEIVFSFER